VNAGAGDRSPARPLSPVCLICHSDLAAHYASACDRLFGIVPGRFELYRCSGCGCVYQNPIPKSDSLTSFYPEAYWWSDSGGSGSTITRVLQRLERSYREFVVSDHVRFLARCARGRELGQRRLLDIGFGSGTFLQLASRQGFAAHGMDISETAVRLARERYGLDVRQGDIGSDLWAGVQFDFVTMFHVLEHLPDPAKGVEYAVSLLKQDGSLIVQVPNIVSLQARFFGPRWYGLDVPRHLVNFSPRALRIILGRAGLGIRRIARFSLRDDPAALASSLAPGLDPIGRKGRRRRKSGLVEAAAEVAYFTLVLGALVPAALAGLTGHGATIWVEARRLQIR
jgi:2-polyprenyl-3-methyl-5-hydroxy-6-metoxy-1,4-benzoquinol methylase